MTDVKLAGERIKQAMENTNTSAEELAEAVGVHKSTIHRYINGDFKRLNLTLIDRIASTLHVSPAWIIGKTDSPVEDPDLYPLKARDLKDIEQILNTTRLLLAQDGLMFDGQPADEESIQSIVDAMDVGLELAKKRNKQKYTPDKYKKD